MAKYKFLLVDTSSKNSINLNLPRGNLTNNNTLLIMISIIDSLGAIINETITITVNPPVLSLQEYLLFI
jgi:hypothetical protein